MNKILRWFCLIILAGVGISIAYVLVYFPAIMAGMDAKVMCSCVFVTGRSEESVKAKELQVFPGLTWAEIAVNHDDSSVTASLLWTTRKAIFREGLGCTLLAERSEKEVRTQRIRVPEPATANMDTIDWPTGDRVENPVTGGIDQTLLTQIVDSAFIDADPSQPNNTHAVVIIHDGKIVAEKYAPGFSKDSRHMGWSMTKSVNNALIGIMLHEKKFDVSMRVPIGEWHTDDRQTITFDHLLRASSGLRWSESYFIPSSTFHEMFMNRDDKGGYAASLELEDEPGAVWEYSSGTSNILSKLLRHEIGDEQYYQFPYQKLFRRIGAFSAIMEVDASGTFVASSYSFATARDWGRLGLLYLNDGKWAGEQILPAGWVSYSLTPATAAPLREYGAQIWLNLGSVNDPSQRLLPGVPTDAFLFEGFERNSVTIIPSRKLVVVRLGVTHNGSFHLAKFLRAILTTIP
jgi:CubicO group peptidase (beta-lactamase class C family)